MGGDLVLVRYHRWRAIWAIAVPFVALAIPAVNLILNPADFRVRWVDDWLPTAFFGVGVVWFIYALWPSAFRYLGNGLEDVCVDADALIFGSGKRYNLNELSAVEILRPALQPPRVALQFGSERVTIETAYQPIGEKKSAETIANAIAEASRRD